MAVPEGRVVPDEYDADLRGRDRTHLMLETTTDRTNTSRGTVS